MAGATVAKKRTLKKTPFNSLSGLIDSSTIASEEKLRANSLTVSQI